MLATLLAATEIESFVCGEPERLFPKCYVPRFTQQDPAAKRIDTKKQWPLFGAGEPKSGIQLADLRTLFDTGITARAILEPLASYLYEDRATDVAEKMRNRDFDVAGLKFAEDRAVDGYLVRDDLMDGLCKDHKRGIELTNVVADTTPLTRVLADLKSRERVFVLSGDSLDGIITRADLQKHPVRIMMFAELSLLEMHMEFWVRRFYGSDELRSVLREGSIRAAQQRLQKRKVLNLDIDLVACLTFADKKKIVLKDEKIGGKLGVPSQNKVKDTLDDAKELRDRLAHAQDLVSGSTWEDTIETIEGIESMILRSESQMKQVIST